MIGENFFYLARISDLFRFLRFGLRISGCVIKQRTLIGWSGFQGVVVGHLGAVKQTFTIKYIVVVLVKL